MRGIVAKDTAGIAAELEAFVRQTAATSLRFVGAVVLVLRPNGQGIFSVSGFTPSVRIRLGTILMKLGKDLVDEARKEGGTLEKPKPSHLVGIT